MFLLYSSNIPSGIAEVFRRSNNRSIFSSKSVGSGSSGISSCSSRSIFLVAEVFLWVAEVFIPAPKCRVLSKVGSTVGSVVGSTVGSAVGSAFGSAVVSAVRLVVYVAVGSAIGSVVVSVIGSTCS